MALSWLLLLLPLILHVEAKQASQVSDCERKQPGCTAWPAYLISWKEFEAANGSAPAGLKTRWEESEASLHPYRVELAVAALLELKSLVLEDPWGYTADWSLGRHPCDFSQVACSQHGVVTGVDLAGMAPHAPAFIPEDRPVVDQKLDDVTVGKLRGRTSGGATDRGGADESFVAGESQMPLLKLKRLPEGPAWQHLGQMSLKSIRFDNARFEDTQALPEAWSEFQHLAEVSLSSCGLEGTLPGSWGELSKLKRVSLGDNALTGQLPGDWVGMESLQTLDISLSRTPGSGSRLSGTLPSEWRFLDQLRVLELWNQGLTGSLPASWARLPALEVVSLSGTQISGSLPESWGRLANLTTVHLADTGVSGQLPSSWGSMRNLTWFDARGTRIGRGVPRTWKSFCQGKKTGGRFPSFAYLPWNGVTEINSARGESQLNLCSAWRRRRRRGLALVALLMIAVVLVIVCQQQKDLFFRWASTHEKKR